MKKIFSSLFFTIIIFQISFSQSNNSQSISEKYTNAMHAYHVKNYIEAHKLFEEFIKNYNLIDELNATAKYYSADALLNLGETDAAAEGFEFIVNNYAWSSFRDKALYKLGLIYFQQEKFSLCRSKLKLLLEEYPSSEFAGSSFYWIGESYTKEDKLNEAVRFLEEAVNKKKNNNYVDYSIFTLASTYEKIGDYEKAVKYYDQLLSFHQNSPLAPAAQIRIGICYFKLKDYQSSILELNNPDLANLPDNLYSESIYLLANSYYRVEKYKEAEKTYKEIIQKFPSSDLIEESKYGLAWTYFQQKKYDEAYNLFNELSQNPDQDSIAIKSFYWKAEAKRYSGEDETAFNIYKEFLNKFPNNELASGVQYQIGSLYFDDKNFENAEEYLTASESATDNTIKIKALTLKGEINLSSKKFIEAKQNFKEALNVQDVPDELRARALLGLGSSLYYLRQYEDAINYLSDISSKDPDFEKDKVNFYLAESYYALGNYSNALKQYNLVDISNNEVGKFALYGKAYSYFSLKNYSNSASQFSNFIKNYPNDPRALDAKLRLADSYYGSKNFAAASKVYKDIFNFDNVNDPYTNYQYAQALFKAGSRKEAIDEFQNLQQKYPNSEYADKSLYVVGWIYFQQSNFEEAISNYKNVLKIYPNSDLAPIIYYSIGDAYFNLNNYKAAIENYQKVLNSYPRSNYVFDAVNGIQYSYVAEGNPEKAINLIDDFISKNPGLSFSDQIFFKKGEIYYSQGEYEQAKISYKEFIANYPNSRLTPDAYYWIGKSAQNLNQNQEAIYNFNRVFNNYPNSESSGAAIIEIGNIYRSLKLYDSAVVNYDRAINNLKSSTRLPEILFLKGTALSDMQNIEEAYSAFAQIVNDYPSSIFADKSKLEIGIIELAANRFSNADNFFDQLANSRTDELGAKAQYYSGISLLEQGKLDSAVTAFTRVRTVFSGYDEWLTKSYLKLGETFTKMEDFDQAKDIYRAVLAKHKGDEFGREAQKKLRELQ